MKYSKATTTYASKRIFKNLPMNKIAIVVSAAWLVVLQPTFAYAAAQNNTTFARALNDVQNERQNTANTSDTDSSTNPNPSNTTNNQAINQTPSQSNDQIPTEPNQITSVPANPHNPNAPTLLEAFSPNDSELSQANTQLLAKNANLTRQVDDLTTQVNVLTQERSGQLFAYGAITAMVAMIIGFVMARLLGQKRW